MVCSEELGEQKRLVCCVLVPSWLVFGDYTSTLSGANYNENEQRLAKVVSPVLLLACSSFHKRTGK